MARDKFRGKSEPPIKPGSRIKSESKSDVLDELVRFSFKFYDSDHATFNCHDQEREYFWRLLGRIKDLSKEKIGSLTSVKPNSATRFHRIDFSNDRVSVKGFGIPGWEEYNEDAWQFSISTNKHGRVHGFLIVNVFYVVWLDADHKLYPHRP